MHWLPLLAVGLLHLLPRPQSVIPSACGAAGAPIPHTVSSAVDAGALELVNERWRALGIGPLARSTSAQADVTVRHGRLQPQGYTLETAAGHVTITAGDADGVFYAMMTLAQLPQKINGRWRLPCAHINDAPALRWRILSDDVSRGPLPTMRYFKERIRTIAAFKMNGYSPYMEHVFVSPTDPLPAPLDGITPRQLHELATYAKRYHVTLIPEQQSFAHMHNTLRLERYAGMAELPHAFLLSPNVVDSTAYVGRLIHQELRAVPDPPFFHVGSDETATLGEGRSRTYVTQHGRSRVYADHIVAMNRAIHAASPRTRIMLWDDGIENDPNIMKWIPRNAVIVNWHYGAQKSFLPFIRLIASGGLDQMVAPGASNWNEIYPDINTAITNENRFITEAKAYGRGGKKNAAQDTVLGAATHLRGQSAARILGVFQTVWHDDGETLFEATWYPVLYSAASAWEMRSVSPARFQTDFPAAFFGVDDARYCSDIAKLADAVTRLEAPSKYDATDTLFWSSLNDAAVARNMAHVDLKAVRLESEAVETHLLQTKPPLHANAAAVMFLAARKLDLLGRKFQIMQEVANMYADAQRRNAHAKTADPPDQHVIRDLMWCKYWWWELRDAYEELAPLYARAWRYEDRESHLASNLERYHLMAQDAQREADAMYRILYEDYLPARRLPATPFEGSTGTDRGATP